eukprot:Gb_07145 [translate_table: standard]
MEAQEGTQEPKLVLAHKLFLLRHPDVPDIEKVQLKDEVLNLIKADDMLLLYESLCEELGWEIDQDLLQAMRTKIDEELKKLDEKEGLHLRTGARHANSHRVVGLSSSR